MIFIWSTNEMIGSKIIRWGLSEPCSHFAIGFFETTSMATVLESRLSDGVSTVTYDSFKERNQIVHLLQADISYQDEINLFNWIYEATKGVKYDRKAILFWVFVGLKMKILGSELPPRNKFNDDEMLYCVEVLEELEEYLLSIGIDISEIDVSMVSPEMAYKLLKKSDHLRDLI